jgi:predicted transcriptional regulator
MPELYTNQHKAFIMTDSTTMTIRLSAQVKEKLGRLAQGTRRSRSYLAAEAVTAFVERELEIIEGIQRGLADVEAGRTVPHERVMAEARRIVTDAKRNRKKTARR